MNMARGKRLAALAVGLALMAAACGDSESGDDTSGEGGGEAVTLTVLTDNTPVSVDMAEALTAAYHELHPEISFEIEERPGGGDGDNIVKTRLATGEMADIFFYNSGALLQALNPSEKLLDISGEAFVDDLDDTFIEVVSQGDQVFGSPFGTGMGGGIIYNKTIFEEQGLSIPTTWDEFVDNNDALLEAGIAPLGATFATTWTSQLLVLADYYNVAQEEPEFAEQYTANEAGYASTPAALRSFERLAEAHEKGWWNEAYASATYEDGLQMVVDGEVAQYPMLSFALPTIAELDPEAVQQLGFFAQPGPDESTNGLTVWLPAGAYIPADTEHPEEAKAFLAYLATPEAVDVQSEAAPPSGPYFVKGATLPDDVLPAVQDIQDYIDAGNAGPALEFLSPLKGPALEQITVEVGSGIRSAEEGAELYDQDVAKQALQLDLEGW
jgi:raffinose/stachyose/melibiose transport system substrate-binding protein